MKKLIVIPIITIVFFYCSNGKGKLNQVLHKDTIFINTNIVRDTSNNSVYIDCILLNLSKDTILILPNPFLIQSNLYDEKPIWVLSDIEFSTPNILYIYNSQNRINFLGDGEYKPYFDQVPLISNLLPDDSLVFRIIIPKYLIDKIDISKIDFFGSIVYGTVREMNEEKINIMNRPVDNFNNGSLISIIPIDIEVFKLQFSENNSKNFSDTEGIWKTFKHKILFKKKQLD